MRKHTDAVEKGVKSRRRRRRRPFRAEHKYFSRVQNIIYRSNGLLDNLLKCFKMYTPAWAL